MNGSAVDAAIATLLCEGVVSLEESVPAHAFFSPNNCYTDSKKIKIINKL